MRQGISEGYRAKREGSDGDVGDLIGTVRVPRRLEGQDPRILPICTLFPSFIVTGLLDLNRIIGSFILLRVQETFGERPRRIYIFFSMRVEAG
jgi:hypothetical protein